MQNCPQYQMFSYFDWKGNACILKLQYFSPEPYFLFHLDIHSVLSKTPQLLLKLYSFWQFTDWVQYCNTINSIETLQFRTHLWIWITARVIDRELKKAFWEIPLSAHNCVLWSSCLVTNKGLKPSPSIKIFSSTYNFF